jgi:hypothetical protein
MKEFIHNSGFKSGSELAKVPKQGKCGDYLAGLVLNG